MPKAQRVSYSVAVTRIPLDAEGIVVTTEDGYEVILGKPTLNVVDRRLNSVSVATPKGNRKVRGLLVHGLDRPTRESLVTFAALTR